MQVCFLDEYITPEGYSRYSAGCRHVTVGLACLASVTLSRNTQDGYTNMKIIISREVGPDISRKPVTAEETTSLTEGHTIHTRRPRDSTRHNHEVTFKLIFSPRSLQAGHTKAT